MPAPVPARTLTLAKVRMAVATVNRPKQRPHSAGQRPSRIVFASPQPVGASREKVNMRALVGVRTLFDRAPQRLEFATRRGSCLGGPCTGAIDPHKSLSLGMSLQKWIFPTGGSVAACVAWRKHLCANQRLDFRKRW
jgi:hypothetical protein